MSSQRSPVAKNMSTSKTPKTLRKANKAGEYTKLAKRTCKVVKYGSESTSAAASSRSAVFPPELTAAAVEDLEGCCSSRGRPDTFRAVLQSPSNARTGT